MTSRQQLRQQLRQLRNQLSSEQQATAAKHLAKQILQLPIIHSAKNIAGYIANDGEINPEILIKHLWKLGKNCYLPILDTQTSQQLKFVNYQPGDALQPNRYHIPEPIWTNKKIHTAHELDIILLPLVGFDLNGNRLGMGGGYYDKTLAFLRSQSSLNKPYLMGLAHELQKCVQISNKSWDIPLDMVVTDQHIYRMEK